MPPTRLSAWSSCWACSAVCTTASARRPGLKAHELIRCHGLTWSDILLTVALASPPKLGWRDKLAACTAHQHCLDSHERAFVLSLARWRGTPTEKQLAWLDHIYENWP